MSYLVVEEYRTDALSQYFTLSERVQLRAIRPLLYFHNDPTATITLTIKNGATEIASVTQTYSEIEASAGWSSGQYHYGVVKFGFTDDVDLQRGVTYTMEISASSYTFSESSYFGWVKPHEDLINYFSDEIESDFENPFGYEIWCFRN